MEYWFIGGFELRLAGVISSVQRSGSVSRFAGHGGLLTVNFSIKNAKDISHRLHAALFD
jgi:hypothetical protein